MFIIIIACRKTVEASGQIIFIAVVFYNVLCVYPLRSAADIQVTVKLGLGLCLVITFLQAQQYNLICCYALPNTDIQNAYMWA